MNNSVQFDRDIITNYNSQKSVYATAFLTGTSLAVAAVAGALFLTFFPLPALLITAAVCVTVGIATLALTIYLKVKHSQRFENTISELHKQAAESLFVHSNEIIPGLFLGNLTAATDPEFFKKNSIRHVICCCEETKPFPNVEYRHIPLSDAADDELFKDDNHETFGTARNRANAFIDYALKNNFPVLVHCNAGASRSATIVISYLMHRNNLSFEEAYVYVKTKRPIVEPNPKFICALK
jgi:hypothetical protein